MIDMRDVSESRSLSCSFMFKKCIALEAMAARLVHILILIHTVFVASLWSGPC